VVVDDFDIVWSFLFPFEADSELVIDPDAVLTCPIARERLQAITAKCGEIRKRLGGVEADQPCACLIFDVDVFNNALIIRQSLRARVFERADHTFKILPDR
jgi:hypothetical protein